MAKKDPTDLTVEEKLKALYQLQTTLSAIDEKRALRGELPLEVQDLEDDIAGLTTRIEKIQTDIEQFDRAIDQKQHEIEEAQASVERYKKGMTAFIMPSAGFTSRMDGRSASYMMRKRRITW